MPNTLCKLSKKLILEKTPLENFILNWIWGNFQKIWLEKNFKVHWIMGETKAAFAKRAIQSLKHTD